MAQTSQSWMNFDFSTIVSKRYPAANDWVSGSLRFSSFSQLLLDSFYLRAASQLGEGFEWVI